MRTMSATEAKRKFADLLDISAREPVLIQRHDREIAILIAPQLLRALCLHLQAPPETSQAPLEPLTSPARAPAAR